MIDIAESCSTLLFPQVAVDMRKTFRLVLEGKASNGGFAIDQMTFNPGDCPSKIMMMVLKILMRMRYLSYQLSCFSLRPTWERNTEECSEGLKSHFYSQPPTGGNAMSSISFYNCRPPPVGMQSQECTFMSTVNLPCDCMATVRLLCDCKVKHVL